MYMFMVHGHVYGYVYYHFLANPYNKVTRAVTLTIVVDIQVNVGSGTLKRTLRVLTECL